MEGKDLTQGNLFTNMVKFCIPLLITNLLNSLYNIVDVIWIGRLVGDEGMAAATNCWPITLLSSSILSAITVTASVMVAQRFTSKEKDKIKNIITPIYIIAILLGIVSSLVLIITMNFWFKLLNTPQEILVISKQYLAIYLIGYVFYFFALTIIESIRAIGNSRVPLILLTITNVLNIILDPIFILIGLGVAGAAIASAVSMLFGLVINLIYINKKTKLLKFNKKYIKFEKGFLKEIIKLGIPMMFAEFSTIFTIMLEVYISNLLGVVGSSSYGIVSKLQNFFYVIGNSIKSMMTVVIAQFVGKNAINQLGRVMKSGLKIILTPTIIIALFIIFCSRWFCSIFTMNEEVIATATNFLNIVGIAFVLIPLSQMMMGFVLGIGNTKFTFITLFAASLVEVIILIGIQYNYNLPLTALGVSILAWYITNIIFCICYYFSNTWKNNNENQVLE